jgi:hypothetical protein
MFKRPLAFLKMFFASKRKMAFLLQTTTSVRLFRRFGIYLASISYPCIFTVRCPIWRNLKGIRNYGRVHRLCRGWT